MPCLQGFQFKIFEYNMVYWHDKANIPELFLIMQFLCRGLNAKRKNIEI